jgi:hypothetical protein
MSLFPRTFGALSVALLTLAPATPAQQPRNTFPGSPAIVPPQLANVARLAAPVGTNVGVLGRGQFDLPPAYGGFNPYYGPVPLTAPALMAGAAAGVSPYALSTVGGYNPYFGTGAAMSNSGYSMSTTPTGGFGGMGGFWPGYGGFTPNSMGYGFGLMGIADYTRASGQYWKDIGEARMTREKVRQEELETAKRRVQYEMWYETVRPTGAKMRDAEMAAALDRARKDPPEPDILSGIALNTLLGSLQKGGRLNRVAASELGEDTLKHINVTAGTSAGNVGLLKDIAKIDWPDGLLAPAYEESRKQLTSSLRKAVDAVKERERPTTALRRDIDAYFKQINDKLNQAADEMNAQEFIEARRFLNQLGSGIKALKDPNVDKIIAGTWTARGKNVAELVENMTRDGLTFAPAAPGDEAAYRALYLALRNFETALQSESR